MSGFRVTTDEDSFVIRLPRAETDEQTLDKVLDYLELEQLRRQSRLSRDDAADLSTEVKQDAWRQVEQLFVRD